LVEVGESRTVRSNINRWQMLHYFTDILTALVHGNPLGEMGEQRLPPKFFIEWNATPR
tara:strand:- start:5063 stop:5236 length:174 start_codon:yes stop_codon:yes gene_type:complete